MNEIAAAQPANHSPFFDSRSSFTASHRLFVVEDYEDEEAFAKLTFDYFAQFEPVGPEEIFLVDTMVQCDQERRRTTLMQTEVLAAKLHEKENHPAIYGQVYAEDQAGPKLLSKLARQIAGYTRTWMQAHRLLEKAQRRRHEQARRDAEAAASAKPAATETAPEPAAPAAEAQATAQPVIALRPARAIKQPVERPPLPSSHNGSARERTCDRAERPSDGSSVGEQRYD